MATELIIDAQTGIVTERELTEQELDALGSTAEELAAAAKEETIANRRSAYVVEADPLYFGWQRGENTEQAWLDKVAEIRARYPYPA